jgi:hypothetical protein
MHLIQVKRVAWETTEVFPSWWTEPNRKEIRTPERILTKHAATSVPELIEAYLASWRARQPSKNHGRGIGSQPSDSKPDRATSRNPPRDDKPDAVDFVCEQDVRLAAQLRQKIYVHSKTIITPAAQELGTSHKIFITV